MRNVLRDEHSIILVIIFMIIMSNVNNKYVLTERKFRYNISLLLTTG